MAFISVQTVVFVLYQHHTASGCQSVYVIQYIQLSSFCICISVHPVFFILCMYSNASCYLLYVHVFHCTLFLPLCICNPVHRVVFILTYTPGIRLTLFCICPPVKPFVFILCVCVCVWVSKDVCIQSSNFAYNSNIHYVCLMLFLSAFFHLTTRLSDLHLCAARLSVLLT